MKKLLFLLLVASGCISQNVEVRNSFSLVGDWKFRIDSLDQGIENKWYEELSDENVKLPGSMAENWKGTRIVLFLERCHWESTVFVNDKKVGSQNSLATPHEYDITDLIVPGKNLLNIRIDNRVIIPIGVNSHSISDHTQSNWNGITGDISLKATSKVFISDVRVYPDIQGKKAKIIVELTNKTGTTFKGKVALQAESFNSGISQKLKSKVVSANTGSKELQLVIDYPM